MTALISTSPDAQRLEQVKQATAAADGTALFTFDNVPEGLRWSGTVQVPTAPAQANFSAAVGIINWGAWSGGLPFGPIQIDGRDQLLVTASGLSPGVQYSALLVGYSELEYASALAHPAALATTPAIPKVFLPRQSLAGFTDTFLGLFSCADYPGAHFSFQTGVTSAPCKILFTWWQSIGDEASGNFETGGRAFIMAPNQLLNFTVPHADAYLLIEIASISGGNVTIEVAGSHSTKALSVFYLTRGGSLAAAYGETLLLGSVAVVNGATSARQTMAGGAYLYAGPAVLDLSNTGGGLGTNAILEALGADNAWHRVASLAYPASGQTFPVPLVVPAAPLGLTITNGTGSNQTYQYAIYADEWRTGGG